MAINKGLNISSVLNKSGKFGRIAGRFSKTLFGPEPLGEAATPLDTIEETKQTVSISEFKSRTIASFARPSLFLVNITSPPGLGMKKAMDPTHQVINLNCYNAQIPGVSLATTDKDIGYRSVAYQKLYDDVLLSFYCREDFSELEFMQDWINLISSPVTNRFEYYTNYVSTIDIIHISKTNDKTLTTTLHEAYPKKVDPMQLDYGSNDIMRMTVNFTYRHFTQKWGEEELKGEGNPAKVMARRSEGGFGKDASIIDELDPVFLGGTDGFGNESSDDLEF